MENILWNGSATVKPQLSLFDDLAEASLYHRPGAYGFFSILTKHADGQKRQFCYVMPKMAEIIPLLPRDRDTWISQAEFTKPNRRVVNLARLGLLFVDIDCYNVNMTPDQALSIALLTCDDLGLPHPSVVVNSGRGLQLKWILTKALPRFALPRWNAIQSSLVDSFILIGADHNAKDASRVLRLVGTINSKSGQYAKVSYVSHDAQGQVATYDFEYLAEILLPNSRHLYDKKLQNHPFTVEQQQHIAQARLERDARKHKTNIINSTQISPHRFGGKQLAWHRLEDLRALQIIRGGVKPGQSMLKLFWMLNFYCYPELLIAGNFILRQMHYVAN